MTDTETILSKIKKLQNLTEARGATPEEAASACAKAQALLFEHNLAQADVDTKVNGDGAPDPYGKVEHTLEGANRHTITWRRSLLHVVAKYNFCATVYRPGTSILSVIGKRSNVETVLYLNQTLARQIETMASEASRSQLTGRAAYAVSFALGAVSTVQGRLRAQADADGARATAPAADPAGRQALVLVSAARALEVARQHFFPHIMHGGRSRIRSGEGYQAGQRAGQSLSMHRGVGGGSQRQIG